MKLGKEGNTFLKKGFSLPSPNPIPPSSKTFINGTEYGCGYAEARSPAEVSRRRLLSFGTKGVPVTADRDTYVVGSGMGCGMPVAADVRQMEKTT